MQQTEMRPGVYIDRDSHKILRIEEASDLEGREGNWELLSDDPNLGLLGCRELAVSKGFVDDSKDVDWYRFEEGEPADMETIEELNKAQAKADAAREAEDTRTGTLLAN